MIRLLLADDESMTREAIAALLDMEPDITVVAQAGDGETALRLAADRSPDVAFLDFEMPGGGLPLLAAMVRDHPRTRTCILTRHARPSLLRSAMNDGAYGFVAKSSSARVLVQVARSIADGRRYADPNLAGEALSRSESPLSARETEILRQVAGGVTTGHIAARLNLAPGTVRNRLSAIITRLGVRTRYEAADVARRSGWL